MEHKKRILVVDDEEALRITLSQVLQEDGYLVTTASNGAEALAMHKQDPAALIITDIVMPEMNGIDLLKSIRAIDKETQIVVMTSYASLDTAVEALRNGAYDYLFKPFEDIELISVTVRRAMDKIRLRDENKRLILMLENRNKELETVNEQLRLLATCDGLTGLYNHRFILQKLNEEINRCKRYGHCFSLLFMDLDYFKIYNDTLGHLQGDQLLKNFADLLRGSLRKTDFIGRYGGDEFIVLLPATRSEDACRMAAMLSRQVAQHSFAGAEKIPSGHVTISCGHATFPDHGTETEALLRHADQVLYAEKAGRHAA